MPVPSAAPWCRASFPTQPSAAFSLLLHEWQTALKEDSAPIAPRGLSTLPSGVTPGILSVVFQRTVCAWTPGALPPVAWHPSPASGACCSRPRLALCSAECLASDHRLKSLAQSLHSLSHIPGAAWFIRYFNTVVTVTCISAPVNRKDETDFLSVFQLASRPGTKLYIVVFFEAKCLRHA